jgi:hypothetical protein
MDEDKQKKEYKKGMRQSGRKIPVCIGFITVPNENIYLY